MKLLFIILTVLESFFAALSQKPLHTDFSINIGAESSQPMTYNGELTLRGEYFLVDVLGQQVAYDGKTLYTYQPDIDELTLSYPDHVELQQANPFLFASDMRDACNATERDSKDGKTTIITLTPKVRDAQTEISRIVIKIDKATLLPISIEIKEGTKTTTLKAKNPTWLKQAPTWTISKPDAYINDLR